MKHKFLPLLLLVSFQSVHAKAKITDTAKFTSPSGEYRIDATVKPITDPHAFQDMRIDYSVYKNGKMLHRGDRIGGTAYGCLYGDRRKMPTKVIEPLKIGTRQVGWTFKTGGVCGNTSSSREHWVVVWSKGEANNYFAKDFVTKADPIVQANASNDSADVWYVVQEWGKGGTSTSYFVPKVFTVSVSSEKYSPFGSRDLPQDTNTWPTFKDLPYSAPSYVTAGILTFDPKPIQHVADTLKKEETEHLEYVGLPSTKEDLKKLADGIAAAGPTLKEFSR